MNRSIIFKFCTIITAVATLVMQSCTSYDDDTGRLDSSQMQYTALVTIVPSDDNTVMLRLDADNMLFPVNDMSGYCDKETRAIVCYNVLRTDFDKKANMINVIYIDTILTKQPVVNLGPQLNASTYGNDPISIADSWITCYADGYLTLQFSFPSNGLMKPHGLSLVCGANPNDSSEFLLCHKAGGDVVGEQMSGYVAFDLRSIASAADTGVTLRWMSPQGERTLKFVSVGSRCSGEIPHIALRPHIM